MTQNELDVIYQEYRYQDIVDFYQAELELGFIPKEYFAGDGFGDGWYDMLQALGCEVIGEPEHDDSNERSDFVSERWIALIKPYGFIVLESLETNYGDAVTYVVIPPNTDLSPFKQLRSPKDLSWLTVSSLEASINAASSEGCNVADFMRWVANQSGLSQEVQERLKTLEENLRASDFKKIRTQGDGETCFGDSSSKPHEVSV